MTSQLRARTEGSEAAVSSRSAAAAARRPRLAALTAFVLLLLIGTAAALPMLPPRSRPASAPATEFSADRAVALLGSIASVPHATGSPALAEVRRFLLDELRRLGLEPSVPTGVATRTPKSGLPTIARVSNVHARIAGSHPTGRVLLMAHYDSVPTGPGASDDGANVAGILEVARALRAGPQPRNDVDLLFTDAEELGLLGAQAYVNSGATGDPRRVVVVNLEARGVSGPAIMFQMAGTGLVEPLRAADPVTTSFANEVYQRLPNDTDLTAFEEAGIRGLNFAFMDGAAHYHSPTDDLAHVSRRSVQDMGDRVLATVRNLAATDLTASAPDATFFPLFGAVVSYPAWLVLPLAGIAVVGYLVLLWTGRRRGLSLRGVGRAAGTFTFVAVGAAVIGFGGWALLTMLRPEFPLAAGVHHTGWFALGEALLLLGALVAWYRAARRKASPVDVAVGVLGWLAVFTLVCAILLPGGAYLFTWPTLVGVAAVIAALRFTPAGSPARALAGCAAAVPGVVLVLPIILVLLPALDLPLTAVPLLFAALLVAVMAGVLEPLPRRRPLAAAALALAVAAAATVGVGAAVLGYDATNPRPVSLAYVLDTDAGTATWVSAGGRNQPQVGRLLTGEPARLDDRVPSLAGPPMSTGPAPVATGLAEPQVEAVTAGERDGVRSISFRLRSTEDYVVDVYADTTTHEIVDATVDGQPVAGGRNVPNAGNTGWQWAFVLAPRADGVDVRLRTRGSGPLRIRVVAIGAQLPAGVGAPTLRPDLSLASWTTSGGHAFVVRTFQL